MDYASWFLQAEKKGLSLGVFALSMRLRIGHTGGHSICLGNWKYCVFGTRFCDSGLTVSIFLILHMWFWLFLAVDESWRVVRTIIFLVVLEITLESILVHLIWWVFHIRCYSMVFIISECLVFLCKYLLIILFIDHAS